MHASISTVPVTTSTISPVTLTSFRTLAVVDWVAFTVHLGRPSHGGYLKRAYEDVGVSRVRPLDVGPGSAATKFWVELQHPDSYQVIKELAENLDAAYGLLAPPILDGLEVATDFWPQADPMDGEEMTRRLMMGMKPPVITNPRLSDAWESITLPDRAGVDPEMTLYIGNNQDDLMWRVYWKRTDESFVGEDGKRQPKRLPMSEWRARAEVRIRGNALSALGLASTRHLEHFRFERLHALGYFKFSKHAPGVDVMKSPLVHAAAKSLGIDEYAPACVLGMYGQRDSRRRLLRGSRYLITETELTEATRSALRTLSRRF